MREPRPITRIELSEKNKGLRLIAAIALLVIGVIGITVGFMHALNRDDGWQRVQVVTQERSCTENFVLQYHFGESGSQATAVNMKLQKVYADACTKAYQLFTSDEAFDSVNNIYHINHHPNEEITVDPVLYAAFEKMENTPYLYLGPVYAHYYSIIFNAPESSVAQLDPLTGSDAKAYVNQIAEFAADRQNVKLELLGDNRIKLCVSDDYLAFAAKEEIETFIDFAYLTNAFIIDYLADTLIGEGLTNGYLVSADGYTRNLCAGEKFNFNIFDRVENLIYPAGVLEYEGPVSMVFFKDYPTANSDVNYRENQDHFVHLFANPADGIYRASAENLVSYSYNTGCVDVALKMLPCFMGTDFAVPEGVYSIWCEESVIYYNDETVSIKQLLKDENVAYRAILKQ